MAGSSPGKRRWHELFSKSDIHVVSTPGPVNPVGDFLSRWAYPANPALGDVSIHGTAQGDGAVRDIIAAKKEELLARPLIFLATVAPLVTRPHGKVEPHALGAPVCDPPPLVPFSGGEDEAREKPSKTGANCQDKKVSEVPQESNTYTWGECSQRV